MTPLASILIPASKAEPAAPKVSSNDQYLRTDHLLHNLKGRTISSGIVTGTAQGAKFVLNLTSTVILARLLTPHDFGLVAMVFTITGFLRIFKDAGLSIATVQREGITHAQVSNLFWVNVALSGLISLTVMALAPAIAWFYHEPQLTGVTMLLSVTFLLSGCTVQHQALLNRQMRFKTIALIEVGAMLVSFLTGISMALLGCGYWSLVGSNLALEATGLLLTWCVFRWRPQLPTRSSGTRPLLKFGVNLTLGGFIYSMARGCDNLLIGRVYGSVAVGFYSRATALLMRPLEQFLAPISAVFVPTLSRLQAQPERYRHTFLKVFEAIALIGFPLTGILLALAHPLTLVLLGPKWESVAVIFAGLTVAALYFPLSNAANWLFTSQGRGKEMLVSSTILSVILVASFAVGLSFGPVGVAIAWSASGLLIRLPILFYMAGRRGPVRTSDLWATFFRHLPAWGIVFGATYFTERLIAGSHPWTVLLTAGPVGLLAAVAYTYAFSRQRQAAAYFISALRMLAKSARPSLT